MGHAHVLWIYEDGFALSGDEPWKSAPPKLVEAVGRAVIQVCAGLEKEPSETGYRRKTSAEVLHHGNAVNWVDDPHANDRRLYFWQSGYLRSLSDLDSESLSAVAKLLEDELARRQAADVRRDEV